MSKVKFRLLVFFIGFIMFSAFFASTTYIQAATFGTKWNITNSSGAVVKVRNAGLPSTYSSAIAPGIAKWNNSGARMKISTTTTAGSGTINIQSMTSSSWKANGWGTGEAWAQPIDLKGAGICSPNPLTDPSKKCTKVDSGIVWINSGNISSDSKRRAAVVTHEIGHIVGLAHRAQSDIKSSIMCANLSCTYDVQPSDVNRINGLY